MVLFAFPLLCTSSLNPPSNKNILESMISNKCFITWRRRILKLPLHIYFTEVMDEIKGDSANAVPHERNYASEFPTFGEIAEVNSTGVQWSSLALGEPPS